MQYCNAGMKSYDHTLVDIEFTFLISVISDLSVMHHSIVKYAGAYIRCDERVFPRIRDVSYSISSVSIW